MGNTNHRLFFALTAPDYNVQDPRSPPSYQDCTAPSYNPSLTLLFMLDAFKITDSGKEFLICDTSTRVIFRGKHVKTKATRGLALRESYDIVDNGKNIVFKALQCEDLSVRPGGLLGFVDFECRGFKGADLLSIKIYDYGGNVIITSFKDGSIIRMVYNSNGQCIGNLLERNTHGTKGNFPQDLDLNLKACILFAAALTSRYCHHDTAVH